MKTVDGVRHLSWWDVVVNFIRGGKPPPEKRWSPTYFLNLVSGIAIVMILGVQWLSSSYALGINEQEIKCLPGTVFWVAREDLRVDDMRRGGMYSYTSEGLGALLPDGYLVAKLAAGLPGDRVEVSADGIFINGERWGELNPITLEKAGLTVEQVTRSFVVPEGEVLMLGTLPRSYDGRYWGTVKARQLVGRTWRLW